MNLKPKIQIKPWTLNVRCLQETKPETKTRNQNPKSRFEEHNETKIPNLSGTKT